MSLNVDIKKKRLLISVEGDMTIPVLPGIREAVLSSLSKAKNIEFDLSEVEDLDSAGFQLLFAVKNMAETSGMSMTITSASSAVKDCLKILRMSDHFGLSDD